MINGLSSKEVEGGCYSLVWTERVKEKRLSCSRKIKANLYLVDLLSSEIERSVLVLRHYNDKHDKELLTFPWDYT